MCFIFLYPLSGKELWPMLTPAPWHPMDHNTVIPRPWPCLLPIPHCYDLRCPFSWALLLEALMPASHWRWILSLYTVILSRWVHSHLAGIQALACPVVLNHPHSLITVFPSLFSRFLHGGWNLHFKFQEWRQSHHQTQFQAGILISSKLTKGSLFFGYFGVNLPRKNLISTPLTVWGSISCTRWIN